MKCPQLDKHDEIRLATTKLIDVLQSPYVFPLFKYKNDTATALKKLSDIFMSKLQSTASSNEALCKSPCTSAAAILSSPRVIFPLTPRLPITKESARDLRAKK